MIVEESINKFISLRDKESKYNWLSLTRQIFKEQSCEILKLNQIYHLTHFLEGNKVTKTFEFIMKGEFEKAIKILDKMEKANSFDIYLRDLPYKLFYRRLDFINDEINNNFNKAKLNEKIINQFKINTDDDYSSDYSIENDISKKSLNPITLNNIRNDIDINSNNLSENINENSKDNNNINLNSNLLENRLENFMSNMNNQILNNQAENENQNNEESDIDNYDQELNELKLDSLLSQNYDLDESNFELNTNDKTDEEYSKNFNYPRGRGGHTMVLDEENFLIYLFAGWDGNHELNDFWYYDIMHEKWNLISLNTSAENGPSPRSCHRMVYDNINKKIYIYGRYKSSHEAKNNKLYEFDINTFKWNSDVINQEIDENGNIITGGPGQIYDHQMVIDSLNQIIYIFGGNKIPEKEDINGI